MHIIEWPQFREASSPLGGNRSAITVGVFDGVHRGHQALIDQVVSYGRGTASVVVTFRRSHHKKIRGNGHDYPGDIYPQDIMSFRQKMAVFESLGVSAVIVIEFSESFRRMAGKDFLRILQERGSMGFMAAGSDFRCGYRLDTGADDIREFNAQRNIPTAIVPPLTDGEGPVSSSKIRAAISRGDLTSAEAMLGRPFTVDLGRAEGSAGDGRGIPGRGISVPGHILPPPGTYAVLLHEKKDGTVVTMPSQILIEGDAIILISADAPLGGVEYVEFCT